MKRIIYQLLLPVALLILSAIVIVRWPELASYMNKSENLQALLILLPALPYVLFLILISIGWRFNNAGLIVSSLILACSYFIFIFYSARLHDIPMVALIFFLLPFNLIFASFHAKRRMLTAFGDTWIAFIAAQIGFILLISAPFQYQTTAFWIWLSESQPHFVASHTVFAQKFLDFLNNDSLFDVQINFAPIALLYLLAFIVLTYRFSRNLNIALVGYMGALISILFSLLVSSESGLMICFSTAGLIMLITTIEASFSLAYIDELTKLPSRRSLDEVMLSLGKTYTIAMLDIDHFKRFNDRYGHKTGDDVLAMVAQVLSKLRGDAKIFRYGGEEFTAIFQGKTAEEAKPYLEKIRQDIAASEFVVRSRSRKKKGVENRGGDKTEKKAVTVTVSIGVATSSKELDTPEKVIKVADTVLYKAKRAGRNRLKVS